MNGPGTTPLASSDGCASQLPVGWNAKSNTVPSGCSRNGDFAVVFVESNVRVLIVTVEIWCDSI